MGTWRQHPGDSRRTILTRVSLGFVILLDGYQTLNPADVPGAGRFAKIGIPVPELVGPLVEVTNWPAA